jgi:hypothetical protein
MNNEPSFLDFKTERDINYAIANAFIYALHIDRYKFHLDSILWNAEQVINDDLFTLSAPWYKGYIEQPQRVVPNTERPSDNPSKEEQAYIERDKNLTTYVPNHYLNPTDLMTDMSYQTIDNRIGILALSWWTMFISTKDGHRMIYFPYTSQLADWVNLQKYPSRNVYIKDDSVAEYYNRNYAFATTDSNILPDVITQELINDTSKPTPIMDINFIRMKELLELEGLNFVLWLYNSIKANGFLVPYDFMTEYRKSTSDTAMYRDGRKVDIYNQLSLAREGMGSDISSATNSRGKLTPDKHGSTGMSQSGFFRNSHSCGLLINPPENIEDLQFTAQKIRRRLNSITADPYLDAMRKLAVKINSTLPYESITSEYVINYLKSNPNISIKSAKDKNEVIDTAIHGTSYVIVSSTSGPKKIFLVRKNDAAISGYECEMIAATDFPPQILDTPIPDRIRSEAIAAFNLHMRMKYRPLTRFTGAESNRIYNISGLDVTYTLSILNKNIKEDHVSWKKDATTATVQKATARSSQARRSR